MGSIKKAVGGVVKTVTRTATNIVKSSGKAVESAVSGTGKLLTGNVSGALDKYGRVITNAGNVASGGTVDLTGRGGGIININSPKYFDALTKGAPKIASSSGLISVAATTKKKGLTQLRQGKGAGGGGSFTEVAKDSLGGASGSTGK